MRPTSSTSTTNIWRSPIPYLFGGLGLMMLLISVALIMLACSLKKISNNSSTVDDEQLKSASKPVNRVIDMEPKLVVIMAGDDKPTYIATPITSSSSSSSTALVCCDQV
ncbi:hypothetical protein HS088_TW04G00853 [Tripterygium wilfordii]|uniref:Uncharacterized protein n=1 Tax=Tripterygium wilfordii TaxID=458696 RepID=A0A7J7DR65_TRIWF|nr:hypothetical protein HS088_TW04G00853 [Tripterygium wilfordii]